MKNDTHVTQVKGNKFEYIPETHLNCKTATFSSRFTNKSFFTGLKKKCFSNFLSDLFMAKVYTVLAPIKVAL